MWLGGSSAFEQALWITDTHDLALLHTLDSQSRNQSSTNTRSVLSWQDLNWIMTTSKWLAVSSLGPVEDLLESYSSTRLEVRVLDMSA